MKKRLFMGDEQIPNGYKPNPNYFETKSKRLQVVTTPSLFYMLKEKAKMTSVSVNELVNIAIERMVTTI